MVEYYLYLFTFTFNFQNLHVLYLNETKTCETPCTCTIYKAGVFWKGIDVIKPGTTSFCNIDEYWVLFAVYVTGLVGVIFVAFHLQWKFSF